MLYTTVTIKEKEFKLRLNANMTVQVEKQIGKNPLAVVAGLADGIIPTLNDLLIILWGALQPYHSGYTIKKVYDLYDDYVADGKSLMDLAELIMDVMKVSGFIKDDEADEDDTEEKNA